MKKISSLVSTFIVAIAALTEAGLSAAVDGALVVVSSDPGVLQVTPLVDGTHRIEVVGVGLATLTVSGDADLGDGVRTIHNSFEFEVYDGAGEADHFDLSITGVVRRDAEAVEETTAEADSASA